jgi:hypothetical protein
VSIGNLWLGSVQLVTIAGAQNLATNTFNMATVVQSVPAVIDQILINVAVACTETLTIAKVPVAGTQYSTIIFASSTSGHTSFFWQPDRPLIQAPGDQLKVNVSNGNATGQIYGSILTLF